MVNQISFINNACHCSVPLHRMAHFLNHLSALTVTDLLLLLSMDETSHQSGNHVRLNITRLGHMTNANTSAAIFQSCKYLAKLTQVQCEENKATKQTLVYLAIHSTANTGTVCTEQLYTRQYTWLLT